MPLASPNEGWGADNITEKVVGQELSDYVEGLKDLGASDEFVESLHDSDLPEEQVFTYAYRFAVQAGLNAMNLLDDTKEIFEELAYHEKKSKPGRLRSIINKLWQWQISRAEHLFLEPDERCIREVD